MVGGIAIYVILCLMFLSGINFVLGECFSLGI